MASDDEVLDPDEVDDEGFSEVAGDDSAELDDDPDLIVGELEEGDLEGDDLEPIDEDDEAAILVEEDEEADDTAATKRPKRAGSDDDEDDLTQADDVEEDLAKILSERLRERAADDDADVEEEEEESPTTADPDTSIVPKRPDERMCPQCFLLVRKGAPVCPVADDTCPLFS